MSETTHIARKDRAVLHKIALRQATNGGLFCCGCIKARLGGAETAWKEGGKKCANLSGRL
ncbi:hypothetical protein ACFPTO_14240 [Paraburkholderia denitrificans]|uniref:Uncharacterized protein n=1 Tax=Paraburkholderia denitrificans TaxID=694025 RepID=A0ABW0JAI1_9BURK